MTLYADILIAENIIINGIMLLSVNLLCHIGGRTGRIAASAVFGGVYSLVIFLSVPPVLSVLLKILPSFIMTLIAFGFHRLFLYLRRTAVLFAVSAFTGGIIYLFAVNLYPEGLATENGQIYLYLSPVAVILSAAVIFIILSVLSRIRPVQSGSVRVKITYKEKSVTLTAFPDTGNTLKEPLSALPVAVGREKVLEKVLPTGEVPFRVVEYSTLSGRGICKAFRPDKVSVITKKGELTLPPLYIALTDGDTGPWDLILPGNYIEE